MPVHRALQPFLFGVGACAVEGVCVAVAAGRDGAAEADGASEAAAVYGLGGSVAVEDGGWMAEV